MKETNVIQWSWFLKMGSSLSSKFPQMARKIDTKLANALAFVPASDGVSNVLAYRNLKKGLTFGLPAGTAMARKFEEHGIRPIESEPDALWFYILREAELLPAPDAGNKLGALGSAIVCATFASLSRAIPPRISTCPRSGRRTTILCSVPGSTTWTASRSRTDIASVTHVDSRFESFGSWGFPSTEKTTNRDSAR